MGILYNSYAKEKRLRSGRSHLKRCLELLNGKELNRRTILIVMRATMQLEYIFHKLKEPKQCCPYSHKAIGFYLQYTSQLRSFPMPFVTLSVSLDVEKPGSTDINSMMTLFSNLLEHVKTCALDEWDPLDIIPIHNLLMVRATVMSDIVTDGLMWIITATPFYVYLLHKYRFSDTRNYLAVTQYILDTSEGEFNATKKPNRLLHNKDISTLYSDTRMHLELGWAKYGNMLLLYSQYKLFQQFRTKKADTSRSTSSIEPKESAEPLTFNWENLDQRLKDIACQVTDKYVSNLRDAKAIFVHTTKWLEKSKAYFLKTENTLFLSLYLTTRYNITLTYKHLECFEPDRSMRINMHKRRVQMLKDVLILAKGLKGQFLLYICIDIVTSYGAIIDMLMENAEIAGQPFTEIETAVLEYVKNCVESWENYYNADAELPKLKKK
ncbi:hypothetical protein X777_09203 [Ooceraea biroi]|uniref:KIF-binding protein n=2 Tax=Ooceraea biroi TaxID=2015173 RepID=A0A026W7S5_OOCBI|nr:hypothetical protein X777_09203 [Ooceraea biroi]